MAHLRSGCNHCIMCVQQLQWEKCHIERTPYVFINRPVAQRASKSIVTSAIWQRRQKSTSLQPLALFDRFSGIKELDVEFIGKVIIDLGTGTRTFMPVYRPDFTQIALSEVPHNLCDFAPWLAAFYISREDMWQPVMERFKRRREEAAKRSKGKRDEMLRLQCELKQKRSDVAKRLKTDIVASCLPYLTEFS